MGIKIEKKWERAGTLKILEIAIRVPKIVPIESGKNASKSEM